MWSLLTTLKFVTLLFLVRGFSARHHNNNKCKFPRHWKGRWYQNGLHELNIKSRAIEGKGHCEQLQGDFFLLKNKDLNCYQCMLIIERHRNILQYRESFCSTERSLMKLCRQITVEEAMFTLIREPAIPITCPLTDAYYFTYKTAQSSTCSRPQSYVKPCVGNEKLQMHFSHCEEKTALHGADLDLDCLAVWKEGSEMFMYGKVTGPTIVTKEESYRCFKYEQGYNNKWYMTMSLDSTCRGLFTARLGPFMMELHKDVDGWPSASCKQPHWLLGQAWRDLKGDKVLIPKAESTSLLLFEGSPSQALTFTAEYKCVDDLKKKDDQWIVLTFLTSGCTAQFKCMKIKLLDPSVMILQFADVENRAQGSQCISGVEYTEDLIVLPNTESVVPCPYPGIYPSTRPCSENLQIGCRNDTSITHRTTCPGQSSFSIECKVFWEDGPITHIIGHPSRTRTSQLSCYSFKKQGKHLEWRSDPRCVLVNNRHFSATGVLEFSSKADPCFSSKEKSHENEVIKWIPSTAPSQKRSHRQNPSFTEASNANKNYGDQVHYIAIDFYSQDVDLYSENNEDVVPYKQNRNIPSDVEYSSHRKGNYEQTQMSHPSNSEYSTAAGCSRSSCLHSILMITILIKLLLLMY